MSADAATLTLWLLRHAKAAPDPPPGGSDHDRPLAPRGRRDAEALGRRISSLGQLPPVVVLVSTAQRALETAEAATAPLGVPLDRRRQLYYGTPGDVLGELATVDDGVRSVMIVGHNPATHELALELLDADDAGRDELRSFPTCGLAVYAVAARRWREVAPGTAHLEGFHRPPY